MFGDFYFSLKTLLIFHFLLSSLLALFFFPFFLKRYKDRKRVKFLTLFFILLLSGPLGIIIWTFLFGLFFKRLPKHLPIEPLIEREPEISKFEGRKYGESVVSLKSPNLNVAMYLSSFFYPISFSYLKSLLQSSEEELRLTAFTRLSRVEHDIVEKIELLLSQLPKLKNSEEKADVLGTIAQLYWDLFYLKLAEPELEGFYLEKAEFYAKESLILKKEKNLLFLLGRIYLKKRKFDLAIETFEESIKAGLPLEKVAPYLIEAYFYKREFNKIFSIIKQINLLKIVEPKAYYILKFWRRSIGSS
jgi:tetratricopeptide (TPR) repeat protein